MTNIIKWILVGLVVLFILYRLPLQGNPPQEMIDKAKEFDKLSKTKLELVENVYHFVNNSYSSPIRQYLREPTKIFMKDIETIWQLKGSYMPSHIQNEMVKRMLLITERFSEEDFITTQGWCEISPHTVLFVKVDYNKTVAVDTWLSDHGGLFNCFTQAPCGKEHMVCLN